MESRSKRRKGDPQCRFHARRWVAIFLREFTKLMKLFAHYTSFLPEPNLESGANIDCCKLYRDNREVRLRKLLFCLSIEELLILFFAGRNPPGIRSDSQRINP